MSIRLENVSKLTKNGKCIIDDVNLEIGDQELLSVVGPSGSGKSTLLRLIAGLEKPTKGQIYINQERIDVLPAQKRNIAMVFQNYALYPHLNVRQNIAFPLKMMKMSKNRIHENVHHIAKLLNIEGLLESKPDKLSGGEKQRVAMGRALIRNPAVFLLDEPLSNLDAKLRVQIRGEIAQLQRQTQTSTIYVTHDQAEAMTLGHRIAILQKGRLMQTDKPEVIYRHPENSFVADFIGNPGMNIFGIDLKSVQGRFEVYVGDVKIENTNSPWIEKFAELKPSYIGIRPEDFQTAQSKESLQIHAQVSFVENFGYEKLIYFIPLSQTGESLDKKRPAVARLDAGISVSRDEKLTLHFHPRCCHFFDEKGQRLNIN